jgi:hypothetical protein
MPSSAHTDDHLGCNGSNHRDIDQAADRDEAMNEFHDGEIFKGKGDWRQHSQLFLAGNLRKREACSWILMTNINNGGMLTIPYFITSEDGRIALENQNQRKRTSNELALKIQKGLKMFSHPLFWLPHMKELICGMKLFNNLIHLFLSHPIFSKDTLAEGDDPHGFRQADLFFDLRVVACRVDFGQALCGLAKRK